MTRWQPQRGMRSALPTSTWPNSIKKVIMSACRQSVFGGSRWRYNQNMVPKERPYHIQAIYDLRDNYSPEHFRSAVGECRKVIAQLIADDNTSNQQVARVHILRYLDLQLS